MARRETTGEGTRALRRSWHVAITWRAVMAILIGVLAFVFAYLFGRVEHLVVGCLGLLLPIAGLVYVRLRRPKFEIVRLFSPPVVAVGGVAQVSVRVTNTAATASTPVSWEDSVVWFEPHVDRELASIPPGRAHTRVATYDLHPPRRGLFAVGPFIAEHEDPFGMATSTVAVGAPDRLIVVPPVSSLTDGGPNLTDGEGEAQLVQRRVTGNDDDLTTREYRPGDALRRVHWRASARHGDLMVRQEEHRSHPDARILVDTRRRGYPDAVVDTGFSWGADWASESFEWVVRMLASLGLHLEQAGFRVQIEETAYPQVEAFGDAREARRAEGFLTSLAGVQLLDRALDDYPMPAEGTGPVFAILGDPEDSTVDWLLARRKAGDAGYAFLVEPRPGVAQRLQDAGWTCVEVRSFHDPTDAWRAAATAGIGAVRGAR